MSYEGCTCGEPKRKPMTDAESRQGAREWIAYWTHISGHPEAPHVPYCHCEKCEARG